MAYEAEIVISGDLGISGQARALLALLSSRDICRTAQINDEDIDADDVVDGEPSGAPSTELGDDIEVDSFAWYNGRERGVLLRIAARAHPEEDKLYVTFGEHRSCDDLFVDCWIAGGVLIDPLGPNDMPEEAHGRRRLFPYGALRDAEDYITDLINDFMGGHLALLSWVCPKCANEDDNRTDLHGGTRCPKCRTPVEPTENVQVPCAADPSTWD